MSAPCLQQRFTDDIVPSQTELQKEIGGCCFCRAVEFGGGLEMKGGIEGVKPEALAFGVGVSVFRL